MRLSLSKRYTPIGIDLGSRTIKAAQLVRLSGAKFQLHAGVIVPLPEVDLPLNQHTARHLRDVLFRNGFVGDDIVLAAPNKQLVVDVLDLPPRSSGAPIEQIARMEMARASKLENEPFELECWDLPHRAHGSSTATSMMAVALRHTDAEALIEPFDQEGFNVVAVDARCCALARASQPYRSADSITALIDVGWKKVVIGLVCDGVVIYQRMLEHSGLELLFSSMREEFQLDENEIDYVLKTIGTGTNNGSSQQQNLAQARRVGQLVCRHLETISDETQEAMTYARHRYPETPIRNLFMIGGGTIVNGACESLGLKLNIQVRTLTPAEIVECDAQQISRVGDGVLTAAIGLAMHGAK